VVEIKVMPLAVNATERASSSADIALVKPSRSSLITPTIPAREKIGFLLTILFSRLGIRNVAVPTPSAKAMSGIRMRLVLEAYQSED
jgi:hypothetical protein